MRQLNFNSIQEAVEGEFKRLPAGNYVCHVTAAEDFAGREYVKLLIDICDGPSAGYFSDDFYKDKPWAHGITLSYKDTALNFLKGRLHVISDCNPGFDAEAAWNGGDNGLHQFIGKRFGVCFNEEEYETDSGETKVSVKPGALVRIADIANGTARDPRHKKLDGSWVSLEEAREEEAARKSVASAVLRGMGSTVSAADVPF